MKKLLYLSLIITFVVAFSGFCAGQSDIKKIKERVVTELMKSSVDDSRVVSLLETLKEDGTWPGINYKDVSRTGFRHVRHYRNMVSLARCYLFWAY